MAWSELRNTFSWSFSRHQCFETCLRRYYLNYYASWGGWQASAPPETREIYVQKKLTTRPMWLGSVVHGAAERALKGLMGGRPVAPGEWRAGTMEQARREIQDSEREAWRRYPSRVTAFHEHYYHQQVPPEVWEECLAEIDRQLGVFLSTPVLRRLQAVPHRLVEVEELHSVEVGDVPVWVKLDALVDDGRGGRVVIDWKTGAAHEKEAISAQLGIYGLYCESVHGIPPERIQAMHVNLRLNSQELHPIDRESLDASAGFIAASASSMRARLQETERNLASPDAFPLLPPDARACGTCPFRRSCDREEAPGARVFTP